MDPTGSNEPDRRYLHIKFSKRWDYHRETIEKMYIDERLSTKDIAFKMKDEYMFDADVRQYKYHIKKWGLKKNISSTAKDQVIKVLEKSQRNITTTGEVRYKGEAVDKKKLRRHLQAMSRVEPKLSSDAIIFARWDFLTQAHGAMLGALNHQSPAGSTPSAISVLSPPQMPPGSSPATARSPINAPSSTTVAIRNKTLNTRATSLLDGRYSDFLGHMTTKERKSVIPYAWLDQFWYFSFKTFKHWGKGPRYWTANMLQFDDPLNLVTSPSTPGAITSSHEHALSVDSTSRDGHGLFQPTALCRWSIHNPEGLFYETPSPPTEPSDEYDINNPDEWPWWPRESPPANPITHLQEALRTNEFSNIDVDQLPLSSTQVAKAAARSPEELLVESVGFAIMARNIDLLGDLLQRNEKSDDFKLRKLYPFHLAASYLDGASTCCGIMNTLAGGTMAHNKIKNLFINNLGHTVLDSLMMTILKAHSSCSPEVVNNKFRGQRQFAGAEDVYDTKDPYETNYKQHRVRYIRLNPEEEAKVDCMFEHKTENPDKLIGILWASIQTEYLTYRRLNEGEPWMSENFSMISIIEDIRGGQNFTSLPLVNRQMMKPHCICGRFVAHSDDDDDDSRPTIEHACAFYFSNLEDWNRSTFLLDSRDLF
ncbi:hypothetical protein PG993_004184 [Apiospora rasikravindrae]|uniref:Clr5 domain-containing protein n=1 Tax=Apiospora rasikravindrae TaxID=990691 RepID=A0ABR1TC18_9PEZI